MATLVTLACGGEAEEPPQRAQTPAPSTAPPPPPPPPDPPPDPPPPANSEFDCDRQRVTEGFLADLPQHRLERQVDYSEVESAVLSLGRVTVVHSGCLQWIRQFRFEEVGQLADAEDAEVFARAVELMRALAVAVESRAPNAAAGQIEELASSGEFTLGDDLTGRTFEGDYGISVDLDAGAAGSPILVVMQIFKL